MRALNLSDGKKVIEKINEINRKNNFNIKDIAKKLEIKESKLREEMLKIEKNLLSEQEVDIWLRRIAFITKTDLKEFIETKDDEGHNVVYLIEDKVKSLLKENDMKFSELCEKIGFTYAGLHRTFTNNSLTVETLNKISKTLNVNISYFFENDIIERLTEEIAKHPQNPDLKSFLMGFSRDVSKGLPVEKAALKNINPEAYNHQLRG